MKEELVSFETAKLAKEKGFPQRTKNFIVGKSWVKDLDEHTNIWKPTQALLQRWLREVHKINVIPYPIESFKNENPIEELNPEYTYQLIVKGIKTFITKDKIFESYEEAFEIGLQAALKLI